MYLSEKLDPGSAIDVDGVAYFLTGTVARAFQSSRQLVLLLGMSASDLMLHNIGP